MTQPVNAITKSIESVSNPEVVAMIEKLSEFGLAVSVPHMHDESGGFEELPCGMVSVEENLKVTFKNQSKIDDDQILPVMWRWNKKEEKVEVAAGCGLECRL